MIFSSFDRSHESLNDDLARFDLGGTCHEVHLHLVHGAADRFADDRLLKVFLVEVHASGPKPSPCPTAAEQPTLPSFSKSFGSRTSQTKS